MLLLLSLAACGAASNGAGSTGDASAPAESEVAMDAAASESTADFSAVREKARYYFCKYLDLYIRSKCEQYYACCEKSERMVRQYGNSLDREERGYLESYALEELNFLKPLTALKKDAKKSRGRMSLEEKKELLENTALTPGGIFDEFNYFYFGYVSVDWMELVFEL